MQLRVVIASLGAIVRLRTPRWPAPVRHTEISVVLHDHAIRVIATQRGAWRGAPDGACARLGAPADAEGPLHRTAAVF